MQIKSEFLDIAAYELQKMPPASLFAKESGHKWLVREEPLLLNDDNELIVKQGNWAEVVAGTHVRVPLHSYLSASDDPAVVVAYAFQLGCLALQELGNLPLAALRLSVGHPLVEVNDQLAGKKFRLWLGFAVRG